MWNPFEKLTLQIRGASHSEEIVAECGGLPANEEINLNVLQSFADRRKSGSHMFSTPRKEADIIEIRSGWVDGRLTGGVFTAAVRNQNIKPADYSFFDTPRPGHADYAARLKYGKSADVSGGGRFSGRMTVAIVIAGGVAAQILERQGIKVLGYISEIGGVKAKSYFDGLPSAEEILSAHKTKLPVLENEKACIDRMMQAAEQSDSVGGVIECVVWGLDGGIGGALYDGLEGKIAAQLYAIPAVKGVEFGSGFRIAAMNGSESNDAFCFENGKVITKTNHNGGINGGISNGMPVTLRVAVKPVPSIGREQSTVDLSQCKNTVIKISGRHDVCIVPRAVVCVESAVSLALLDCLLAEGKI